VGYLVDPGTPHAAPPPESPNQAEYEKYLQGSAQKLLNQKGGYCKHE